MPRWQAIYSWGNPRLFISSILAVWLMIKKVKKYYSIPAELRC
jgi:hypothetical protein